MADDNEAIAPALETPASGEQQTETPELETEATEQEVDGEGQDDTDELEFGFQKYRVPKALKEAVEGLRSDATKKHQDASARQKALDEQESSLKQQADATEAELDARAGLRTIASELKKFEGWDWNAYQQARLVKPFDADEAWNYRNHLLSQKAELEGAIGKAAQERTEKAQSELTKRVQETLAEAPKIISGFKPEMLSTLIDDFAVGELGIPDNLVKQHWSPKLLKLIHLAKLGSDLTKKAAAKPAVVTTPAPALATVKTNAPPPPTGLSDRLSPEEWQRRRNAQVRKKAAN